MIHFFKSEKTQWFLKLLRMDIHLLFVSLLIGIAGSVLGIITAVFSQKLIDEVIPGKNAQIFFVAMAALAILQVVRLVASYSQSYIGALHSKRFNIRLIHSFLAKIPYLPKSYFDTNQTGALITRMHDSSAIHSTIMFIFNSLILNTLTLVISTVFIFQYSLSIGLVCITMLPLYFIISAHFKGKLKARLQLMYLAHAETESKFISVVQNADLIKTYNKQQYYTEQCFSRYKTSQDRNFDTGITGVNFGISSETIGTGCYIILLGMSSYQAFLGNITIGEFTAVLTISTGMLGPMNVLGSALMHLQGAGVAFDRIYEIISAKHEFDPVEDAKKESPRHITNISLHNLSFSYDGHEPLLKNINLAISAGDLACICGRNGTGKSTLLNLIAGLYQPSEGSIKINGTALQGFSLAGVRSRIAFVSQQSQLFDGSLLENVSMSSDPMEHERIKQFLSNEGFDTFIQKINGSYEAFISENGNNLSGGQRQILSLARALYIQPDLLLVDEATASLDSDSEDFVIEKLKNFSAAGGMVLMVSHRVKPISAATKLFVLEQKELHLKEPTSFITTVMSATNAHLETETELTPG